MPRIYFSLNNCAPLTIDSPNFLSLDHEIALETIKENDEGF